jgi:hypothetical protein
MVQNVLSHSTPSSIDLDPFAHLIIQNALPAESYAALEATFPPSEVIAGYSNPRQLPSNRRYSMPAWPLLLRDDLAEPWRQFLEDHVSCAFFAQVFAQFAGHWDKRVVARMSEAMSSKDVGLLHRDGHRAGRILLDARVEINSAVVDAPSSARGVHLDTPNRLYSGLFYLRSDDDDSVGGELELFTWAGDAPDNIDVLELPTHLVRKVASIPYRANQLVLFPQGINALHGVGLRHPTRHIRRYVFITAEIEDDWLLPEGARSDQVEIVA